jgi:CRP/FNR family transcriptional regulator, dissimilatory nitrate respiration regulator
MLTALQFLKKSPLFQQVEEKELKLLAANLTKHVYTKNEIIFQEGTEAKQLYLIAHGAIKIYKISPQGKEHILHILNEQQMFAEVPMFAGATYPANAIAIAESIVFSLSREKLIKVITKHPQIALNLLALQAKRLRDFTHKIEQLSLQNTEQKILDYLRNNQPQKSFSIQMLANYLGVSRENLSRAISQLIKNGDIKKEKNKLTLIATKRTHQLIIKH